MLNRRRRPGFTLIELLVVISIIGILVGLLLPAVNAAREAGRRTQCSNNMRQLGLALINFSTSKNAFPAGGTFDESTSSPPATNTGSSIISPNGTIAQSWLYNWVVDIMPYLDQPDIANAWDKTAPYWWPTSTISGQPSNFILSNTALGVLRCPDDTTTQQGQGNLSYAVNGGFVLFTPSSTGFIAQPVSTGLYPTSAQFPMLSMDGTNPLPAGVSQRMGVMFLGTKQGTMPWDYKTSPSGISDGASNTLLISENTLGGYDGTGVVGKVTNWACPLPNFCMFFGSAHVCDSPPTPNASSPKNCGSGGVGLNEISQPAYSGWKQANFQAQGNYDYINYGQQLTDKGSFPFSNSGHPGGCNMVFCDGATRFISSTIDGQVYARMITPAGSRLPISYRQSPLSQDAFTN